MSKMICVKEYDMNLSAVVAGQPAEDICTIPEGTTGTLEVTVYPTMVKNVITFDTPIEYILTNSTKTRKAYRAIFHGDISSNWVSEEVVGIGNV